MPLLHWEIEDQDEFTSSLKITGDTFVVMVDFGLSDERGLLASLLERSKERGEHLTL